MHDADIAPGDSVRINERWCTTATNRSAGIVKRVFRAPMGGTWAAVRFAGQRDDTMCLVGELEPADEASS